MNARMRTTVIGHAIKCAGFRPFPRAIEPSSAVPYRLASQGMSLAPTSRQVHEMQSGLASFAFAIARPAEYEGDAFQASSPKTSRVAFGGPFFCLNVVGTSYPAL